MDRNTSTPVKLHSKRGQARKSLWIETYQPPMNHIVSTGQARKSLWIETVAVYRSSVYKQVRLVRACGSKPSKVNVSALSVTGQARKSLWIETINQWQDMLCPEGQARKSLWIETYLLLHWQ